MNTDPNPAPAGPGAAGEGHADLFAALNGYWEALQRGEGADPEQWAQAHPEGRPWLGHLRLVTGLHEAVQMAKDDSGVGQTPAQGLGTGAAGGTARPLLPPGTVLDQFRIERPLGQGGMGEVYLAEHLVLGNRVAVKVLPARLADEPDALRRFLEEARALARMSPYPNLAAAFHAGEHEGRPYLVMEYVPGVDLKRHVEEAGPLPVARACDFIRQAALGLEYVHGHGLVHRDVKPSNLMLTPGGTIKVLDLGLARHTAPQAPGGASALTPAGAVLGTFDYVAPEQARDARQADARSDLYSLGCTFYFLLTGAPPFEERSEMEKVVAHALEEPRPVSEVRPEERYPSARALIDALDGAAGPRPPGRGDRANRRRAGAAGLLLAVVVVAWWGWGRWRPTPEAPPAPAPKGPGEARASGAGLGKDRETPPPAVPWPGQFIRTFRVLRFSRGAANDMELGALGEDQYRARRDDLVEVEVEFSEPVYAYLIAFNPADRADKCERLCSPGDRGARPERRGRLVYPVDGRYQLDDGAGLQAFVVVASREPLPAYADWRKQCPALVWRRARATSGFVWRGDGRGLERLLAPDDDRGTVVPREEKALLEGLGRELRSVPGVEAVAVLAFAVDP